MQSSNREILFKAMNKCIESGRFHQHADPKRAIEELEKLAIYHDILKSVTNFESKLLSELDVD
jgi:hypothetical protein